VLLHADDIVVLGFAAGEFVDLVSARRGGVSRRADRVPHRRVPDAALQRRAGYPETTVLVSLDSVADVSGTPTSKSVIVRLQRSAVRAPAA
jgi:hypothetical protein